MYLEVSLNRLRIKKKMQIKRIQAKLQKSRYIDVNPNSGKSTDVRNRSAVAFPQIPTSFSAFSIPDLLTI